MLNAFVSDKLAAGLSVKYVSDISVLIKSVCRFARRQYGYANKSEFMVLPKRENDPIRDAYSAGIVLSAATGIRIGEFCALKWSDFDLEKSIFTVSKTMQRIKDH